MQYKFLNIFLNPKELLAQSKTAIDPFLLENNVNQVEKIYEFYKSNANLLYVSGFSGTGKAKIVDYSTAFLSTETIILKYNCFHSTVLDDMLLSFFIDFKKLYTQGLVSEPKIKTENFTQKINSYFSQTEKPFVIILNSFESILDENKKEIMDFISHLSSMPKIKIVIIGKIFESKCFEDIQLERVILSALDRQIFEKYLKTEKIKFTSGLLDELYKHTKGYYFSTKLSIKLMKNDTSVLFDFLTKLKNSLLPFSHFLVKQAITLIPANERNLFWFLSLIRHPISIDLLKKLNFYNEENFNSLLSNLVLINDNSQIYVRDYLKDMADEYIAPHIAQRIRQYIVDLYLTQLPLKPLERDVCISRQTMRKEIEYHKIFIPKKPKNIENIPIDIDYLSYSNVNNFDAKAQPGDIKDNKKEPQKPSEPPIDLTQRKNVSLNLSNLPAQYKNGKTIPPEVPKNAPEYNQTENIIKEDISEEFENLSFPELLELAKQAEENYNYPKVISLYKKALLFKDDKDYEDHLPTIYIKIANSYKKIANYEKALKYYNLAQQAYENSGDLTAVSQIKFNIANVFFETYKIDDAKIIFHELVKLKECSRELVVKSYIQLANIEESLSNHYSAFKYYKLAIELSDENMGITTLSELYFKYALALDDKNDIKNAIAFYDKCINLSGDKSINKFLSSAYSNIATLYMEKNDTQNALKNYSQAFEIDKENKNIEGMYYSASKLASILQRKQPEKALEYLNTAFDCAELIKDVFYIVSASLAIGDYHYDRKQNEIALKHYILALDLAKDSFKQDNMDKINVRINDIKFRLGVEKFDEITEIIRKQQNGQNTN